MNTAVRERLGLSFLAALFIHILALALLSLIPWDQGADLSRMKPVVIFAAVSEQLEEPEPLPEPEPEPAPEPSQVAEEAPVQEAPPEPPAPAPAPAPSAAPAPRQEPAPPAAPRPSQEPRIRQPVQPQAPPSPEQSPADQWSEGPQIVYGDDPADPEEREQQLSRAPEDAPRPTSESLLDDEGIEDRIAAIRSTPSTETGPAGSPSVRTGEESDPAGRPEVSFRGGARRALIDWRGDDIPAELLVGLPPRIEVEVSFKLQADGRPQNPTIVKSSGSTELDNMIQQAVRNSQFSRLESGDTTTDEGLIRLVLQVQ